MVLTEPFGSLSDWLRGIAHHANIHVSIHVSEFRRLGCVCFIGLLRVPRPGLLENSHRLAFKCSTKLTHAVASRRPVRREQEGRSRKAPFPLLGYVYDGLIKAMAEEHDRLFADLDALTEEQIQVGLAAGVWNEQVRPLVQHYLQDRKLKRVEVAAAHLDEVRDAARVAVEEAVKSKTWATVAVIIAAGAMLAAMAAAFVAFLALRDWSW